MEPLTTPEKIAGIVRAMKVGAESVVDGKLDPILLRENIRKMFRENSRRTQNKPGNKLKNP